jgi:dihydrofolate reductase
MRKVVLFMHLSLDGFCAAPDGGLRWIAYDEELQAWADGVVKTVGAPVYGRVTYELMKGYWPKVLTDPKASPHDVDHARWLENTEKIVFSRTLRKEDWKNTTVVSGDIPEAVTRLKEQPGGDLVVFGSPGLARELLDVGLIDEYRLSVSPIILGRGTTAFHAQKEKGKLKLLHSRTLTSGALVLHYQAIR